MSATEKLRRMLDERGVEWESEECLSYDGKTLFRYTYWGDGGGDAFCEPIGAPKGTLGALCDFSMIGATPEQAIEATRGRKRTCTMLRLTDYTCQYMHRYMCSECGEYNEQPTVMGESEPPRYCPNCGAKVVDE